MAPTLPREMELMDAKEELQVLSVQCKRLDVEAVRTGSRHHDPIQQEMHAMEAELLPVRTGRSRSMLATAPTQELERREPGMKPAPSTVPKRHTGPSYRQQMDLTVDTSTEASALRRSMSAEFTLSMLQQELGYPRRKVSSCRSRPGSDRRRRESSILEDSLRTTDLETASTRSRTETITDAEQDPEWAFDARSVDQESSMAGDYEPYAFDAGRGSNGSEEDNWLDRRIAIVTGYSRGTDGIVYYEIIVKSVAHGPLSAYKVRRRYSEFRALHRALARIMPTSEHISFSGVLPSSANQNDDVSECSLRFSQSRSCGRENEHHLPPLPDKGGFWSFFHGESSSFLERRAKYFHAMIVAAQNHDRARRSRLLNEFLGTPPDMVAAGSSVESSYVSLNRFAAPKIRFSIEVQERREKARSISQKRTTRRLTVTSECEGGAILPASCEATAPCTPPHQIKRVHARECPSLEPVDQTRSSKRKDQHTHGAMLTPSALESLQHEPETE